MRPTSIERSRLAQVIVLMLSLVFLFSVGGAFAVIGLAGLITALAIQIALSRSQTFLPNWNRAVDLRRFGVTSILLVVGLNLYAPADPTVLMRAVASAFILTAAVVSYRWMQHDRDPVPFLPLMTAMLAIYYALPAFLLSDYYRPSHIPRPLDVAFYERALLLALLGTWVMIGVFTVVGSRLGSARSRISFQSLVPSAVQRPSASAATIIAIVGLGVYLLTLMFPVPDAADQIVGAVAAAAPFGVAVLAALWWKGELPKRHSLVLWLGVLPGWVAVGFGTGSIYQGLLVVLPLVLIAGAITRRASILILVIAFAAFIPLQTLKHEYRAEFGLSELGNPLTRADAFLGTVISGVDEAAGNAIALDAAMSRLDGLSMLAEVVERTPQEVPFWAGKTYAPLMTKLIPRFLYSDKPRETFGQDFGHRYYFIGPADDRTSVNLLQLVEGYTNFGFLGVLGVMGFLGGIYATLVWFFRPRDRSNLIPVVAGSFVLAQALQIGSNLSLVLPGLVVRTGVAAIMTWIVTRQSDRPPHRPRAEGAFKGLSRSQMASFRP